MPAREAWNGYCCSGQRTSCSRDQTGKGCRVTVIAETCALCHTPGGELLWQDDVCRVVRVLEGEGRDYPGFCRVIWRDHVREMTDLSPKARGHLMQVVFATESAVREAFRPDKINLASLGNLTPHLHWHVIPRWREDTCFPSPIWANSRRPSMMSGRVPEVSLSALKHHLVRHLAELHQEQRT